MITNWNDATLTLLRNDIMAALKPVLAKHGLLDVNGINMRYSANKTAVKFDVYVDPKKFTAGRTSVTNGEATMLNSLGVPLGTKLQSNGYGVCEVIGYNSRKRKFPIITRSATGQEIGFPSFGIKSRIIQPVPVTRPLIPSQLGQQ